MEKEQLKDNNENGRPKYSVKKEQFNTCYEENNNGSGDSVEDLGCEDCGDGEVGGQLVERRFKEQLEGLFREQFVERQFGEEA